jgi:iron complex outermembrane receptor protein
LSPEWDVFRNNKKKVRGALLSVSLVWLNANAETNLSDKLATLPLEQLMQFQLESVSKYKQKTAEAPASVSIVTAQDIKTYGYKTLADILNSMRGLYVSYDRNYSYLGTRGFSVPGDYNTRVLLLVDGVRYNDDIYDQAPIGTDFSIDVDLIDRVEFIAGPTSAVYGSNALLGVINIVTKTGADYRGGNLAVKRGSYGTAQGRATVGNTTEQGGSWLLSATRANQRGQNLYYAEYDTPAQNNGIAEDSDYDRSTTLLAKFKQDDLTVTFSRGERTKGIPTASFEQTFNDRRAQTIDVRTNVGLQYQRALNATVGLNTRLYTGRYNYVGNYIYADSALENRDRSRGEWSGGETQLAFTGFNHQKIVVGGEYRYAARVDQKNFNVDPPSVLLDDNRHNNTAGFYVQDEITFSYNWALNIGDRLDRLATGDWVNSPRVGLIYQPLSATAVKLLYGTAYRTPNAYEQHYFPLFNRALGFDAVGAQLSRERISSKELVLEHAFDASQRLSISLFRNEISDLITLRENPADSTLYFVNDMDARTQGAEIEWQAAWLSGFRIKTSYSWQETRDTNGGALINSPHNLFKLNMSGPLRGPLTYGVSLRAVSARNTFDAHVPGYGAMDVTLRCELADHVELSASLYNALDHRYSDPGSSEHRQDSLLQNARNFLLSIDYWL